MDSTRGSIRPLAKPLRNQTPVSEMGRPCLVLFTVNLSKIFVQNGKHSLRLSHVEKKDNVLASWGTRLGRVSGIWIHTRRFLPLKQPTAAFWLASFQPASEGP